MWQDSAVLLRGASGAGKSDLALRLIEHGAQLVADDQVLLRRDDKQILAQPPDGLAGLLEVRGLGILRLGHCAPARLSVVIDLVDERLVERLPEPLQTELLGISLPLYRLSPWATSAASKVRLAMRLATGSIMSAS